MPEKLLNINSFIQENPAIQTLVACQQQNTPLHIIIRDELTNHIIYDDHLIWLGILAPGDVMHLSLSLGIASDYPFRKG